MARYTRRQIVTLVTVALSNSCSAICISLQAPFYPAVAESKGATATQYGLVFGVFQLIVFLVSPIYGQFISRIGPKFMFNGGIFTTGSTCIMFGFLNHINDTQTFIAMSFVIRTIEALGHAGSQLASFSIAVNEFPENCGTAFSIIETAFGIGLILGPTIGGALYEVGGYTLPFLCLGLLLITAATVTFFVLPPSPVSPNTSGSNTRIFSILKYPSVTLQAISVIASSISIGFIQVALEPHLRPHNLSPFYIGLMFIVNGLAYAVTAPMLGRACDKLPNAKLVTIFGATLQVLAFLLIGPAPFIPISSSLTLDIVALAFNGIGFGAELVAGFSGALKDVIVYGMPDNIETNGLISGMWTSSFALGAFIGPSCTGPLLDSLGFSNSTMFVMGLHGVLAITLSVYLCCNGLRVSHDQQTQGLAANGEGHAYENLAMSLETSNVTYGSIDKSTSEFIY